MFLGNLDACTGFLYYLFTFLCCTFIFNLAPVVFYLWAACDVSFASSAMIRYLWSL